MKALRIKKSDPDLTFTRFEIVLLKDIKAFNVAFFSQQNEAKIELKFHSDVQLVLYLTCDEAHFEKFKLKWMKFQMNEDYYFDLSEWRYE